MDIYTPKVSDTNIHNIQVHGAILIHDVDAGKCAQIAGYLQ